MKKFIYTVINNFMKITTWTLFSTASFITVFYGRKEDLSVLLLWQVLGISALCALLAVFFFYNSESLSKKKMLGRYILSYIVVNIIILAGGFFFGWFIISDWKMVLGMILLIAAGYVVVVSLSYSFQKQEADSINKKLKERN